MTVERYVSILSEHTDGASMELDQSLSRGLAREFIRHMGTRPLVVPPPENLRSTDLKRIQRTHAKVVAANKARLIFEGLFPEGNDLHQLMCMFSRPAVLEKMPDARMPEDAPLWGEDALQIMGVHVVYHRRRDPSFGKLPWMPFFIGIHALTRMYQRVHGKHPEPGDRPNFHEGMAARFTPAVLASVRLDPNALIARGDPGLTTEAPTQILPILGGALICAVDVDGALIGRTIIGNNQLSAKQRSELDRQASRGDLGMQSPWGA